VGSDGIGSDVVEAEFSVDKTDSVGVGGGPPDMAASEGGCKLGVIALICVWPTLTAVSLFAVGALFGGRVVARICTDPVRCNCACCGPRICTIFCEEILFIFIRTNGRI